MAHPRRFRFGIQLSTAARRAEWAELAREAEDLGYSTLFVPDHFGDQLAPVPALTAAADATTGCGSARSCSTTTTGTRSSWPRRWRPSTCSPTAGSSSASAPAGWPATTSSRASRWTTPACASTGWTRRIAVLKGLFRPGPFTFAGKHYRVTDLDGLPQARAGAPPAVHHRRRRTPGAGARRPRGRHRRASTRPSASGRVDAAAARDGGADLTDRKVALGARRGRRPLRRHRAAAC